MNSRNHMKIKKFAIFVKQIKGKHAESKKYCKVRDHCNYAEEYRGAGHSICNLKYSLPKEISIVFNNGCNYHL